MDDIFSMFGDIFGNFGNTGGSNQDRRPQYRGTDLRMKVSLTLQEISTGITKKFKVKRTSYVHIVMVAELNLAVTRNHVRHAMEQV